jgi:hypothetical protein
MKWFFAATIKENTYNALARRNQSQVYLLFTERPKAKEQKTNHKH